MYENLTQTENMTRRKFVRSIKRSKLKETFEIKWYITTIMKILHFQQKRGYICKHIPESECGPNVEDEDYDELEDDEDDSDEVTDDFFETETRVGELEDYDDDEDNLQRQNDNVPSEICQQDAGAQGGGAGQEPEEEGPGGRTEKHEVEECDAYEENDGRGQKNRGRRQTANTVSY